MSSTPGPGRPGSATGPAPVLHAVRQAALTGADALLQHVPDTGDHATGQAVDAFVERAADALRALAEATGATLSGVDLRRGGLADAGPDDLGGIEPGEIEPGGIELGEIEVGRARRGRRW